MAIYIIIALIALGFIFLAVEFLIIPGITVAGIISLLLIGGGIFCGYYFHGNIIGNYVLAGSIVGIVLFLVFILKMKTWKRFGLETEIEGRVGELNKEDVRAGDNGETISRLAPIGKAMINDKIFEVRSDGGYIDAHKNITVNRIVGNKIFVELIK